MRKQKALIELLRGVANLLAEESARNPDFSAKVAALLSELPQAKPEKKVNRSRIKEDIPDIYAEWNSRGESEFRLWLRDQPVTVLRQLIRSQDLDSTRRTTKWKDSEKLADFIADGLRTRLARGGAFLKRSTPAD